MATLFDSHASDRSGVLERCIGCVGDFVSELPEWVWKQLGKVKSSVMGAFASVTWWYGFLCAFHNETNGRRRELLLFFLALNAWMAGMDVIFLRLKDLNGLMRALVTYSLFISVMLCLLGASTLVLIELGSTMVG